MDGQYSQEGLFMSTKINFINLLDADEKLKMEVRIWRNYDFVRNNMLNTHIISEDEHKKYLERLKESISDKQYIAFYGKEAFGVINTHTDFEGKRLEFGYYLTDEKYVDGGFGAILEYALLEHAFFDLRLDTVFCRTLSSNKKVIALHKRFGFDITLQDERLCYQSISAGKWREKRILVGKIINNIFAVENIGKLY